MLERVAHVLLGALLLPLGCSGRVDHGDASGGTLSCKERIAAATRRITDAFEAAAADLRCATDSDCAVVSGGSNCTNSCRAGIASSQGAEGIRVAIEEVDTGVCAGFAEDGCFESEPPCLNSFAGAACIAGSCLNFLPQSWRSLAIDEGNGPDSTYFSIPPSCLAGHACTLWKITPDGAIEKSANGTKSSSTLSSSHRVALDQAVRSVSFRQIFSQNQNLAPPPACDPAPPGVRIAFDLENDAGGMVGMDLTGCALGGPSGNDVQRIYDLIRAY